MNKLNTLVLGLDGLDYRLLDLCPVLKEIYEDSVVYNPVEELWQRGWSKVLSGGGVYKYGGFYNRPLCDNTINTTSSVKTASYDSANPIWSYLNDAGIKSGFLNIPTTMPAPQVDGFFVSGPGGGCDPAAPIPKEACYPPGLADKLTPEKYIWEVRWSSSDVGSISEYIDLLITEFTQKIDVFIELCQINGTQFNFIMLRVFDAISSVLYLSVHDQLEGKKSKYSSDLTRMFETLDRKLRELLDNLNPSNVIVVSDHGYEPFLYKVNLNKKLLSGGFQEPKKKNGNNGVALNIIKKVYGQLPAEMKGMIKKKSSVAMNRFKEDYEFDPSKSLAFSLRYIPGIYLNDSRFYGVVDCMDREKLIADIIFSVNNDGMLKELGFEACSWSDSDFSHIETPDAPDIFVSAPAGSFFEKKGGLIQVNERLDLNLSSDLIGEKEDQVQGTKGKRPVFYYKGVKPFSAEGTDLTIVNELFKCLYI